MRAAGYLLAVAVLLLCPVGMRCAVVDEPLGATYSLGMTLWHLGHRAESIEQFHQFLKESNITPEAALGSKSLKPASDMHTILVDPELLGEENLGGWGIREGSIASWAGDNGPTVGIPIRIARAGFYRLWILYREFAGASAVTSIKIYRKGKESEGPICQCDELYDKNASEDGWAWKDMLVDLPAGELVMELGHVTRWWHGGGGYAERVIDCIYMTEKIWLPPPDTNTLDTIRNSEKPAGAQWAIKSPLAKDELSDWEWWQVRPLSWEQSESKPKLFALSRQFHAQIIEQLSTLDYDEANLPDYREPQRQVVYNETWNMVANPVRAKRQIDILQADISRTPLGYNYVWHDVGENIDGLKKEGGYPAESPQAAYGGWYGGPGLLEAGYGEGSGTVTTQVPVSAPGKYALWVLSNSVNLSYTAPWFGRVSVGGTEQFTYHHEGTIPSVWMKMGEVEVKQSGNVQVDFVLDGAGAGGTYRRIYTLFLVDDMNYIPQGTVRPPWDMQMYRQRAALAGASEKDKLLLWVSDDPYRPLSQEVWADKTGGGDSWPYTPQTGKTRTKDIYMPREACKAVRVAVRGLTDQPITLSVQPGPLKGAKGSFAGAVSWRVETFEPYGADRQHWTPVFLMRRPNITVPPLNVAGIWLTVNTKGMPPGDYESVVKIRGRGVPEYSVVLKVRVSPVVPISKQPVLVDGWTKPHEGNAYMQDFIDHRMNVWPGEMSKADMDRWGIKLLRLSRWSAEGSKEWVEQIKGLGLDYDDYFVGIMDEPGGTTEETLKPFLDVAKSLKETDPKVRVCFNPSEAAQLDTFRVLAPYADFWCPYSMHIFAPHWGNPEKWEIFHPKPWMWYTTPCNWDKTARDPGIRTVPSQPGNCVGVAFFALNYPWRDQWDTAYEHIVDASTMGAVISRHGPVATIVWEHIREASQTATLAMMVREALAAKTFDEVKDPQMQRLIREGSEEELLTWLENNIK